jgi:hypothetical protein
MSRPGIEPGPPAWEASTLEKSHRVGSEHSRKGPSGQLICWLFETTTWAEAGAARGLYSLKNVYRTIQIDYSKFKTKLYKKIVKNYIHNAAEGFGLTIFYTTCLTALKKIRLPTTDLPMLDITVSAPFM